MRSTPAQIRKKSNCGFALRWLDRLGVALGSQLGGLICPGCQNKIGKNKHTYSSRKKSIYHSECYLREEEEYAKSNL